jgi:hypothetical protein
MIITELSGTLIISRRERERNSIPIIQTKLESQLNKWMTRTTVIDHAITFKTINTYTNSGFAYRGLNTNSLRIYKEGKIVIDKEGKLLKIRWIVKLDTLYIIALFSSIMAGITAGLYLDTDVASSVSIGIIFFFLFIFLGILLIKYKLIELIEDCVYKN